MQFAGGSDSGNLRLSLLPSVANPFYRPCGVFCDQWLRVSSRALERWEIGWAAHVAERNTDIA